MEKEIEKLEKGFNNRIDRMENNVTLQMANMSQQLEKYWQSSNRAFESNSKTIEKISDILQEFQVMVARSYVDKSMMGDLEDEMQDRISLINEQNSKDITRLEDEIKCCRKEVNQTLIKAISFCLGIPAVIISIINVIKAVAN